MPKQIRENANSICMYICICLMSYIFHFFVNLMSEINVSEWINQRMNK